MAEYTLELFYNDVPLQVTFDYSPGDPGKLTGPWEDSWPPEPEAIIINAVRIDGHDIFPMLAEHVTDDLYAQLDNYDRDEF